MTVGRDVPHNLFRYRRYQREGFERLTHSLTDLLTHSLTHLLRVHFCSSSVFVVVVVVVLVVVVVV